MKQRGDRHKKELSLLFYVMSLLLGLSYLVHINPSYGPSLSISVFFFLFGTIINKWPYYSQKSCHSCKSPVYFKSL